MRSLDRHGALLTAPRPAHVSSWGACTTWYERAGPLERRMTGDNRTGRVEVEENRPALAHIDRLQANGASSRLQRAVLRRGRAQPRGRGGAWLPGGDAGREREARRGQPGRYRPSCARPWAPCSGRPSCAPAPTSSATGCGATGCRRSERRPKGRSVATRWHIERRRSSCSATSAGPRLRAARALPRARPHPHGPRDRLLNLAVAGGILMYEVMRRSLRGRVGG